MATEAGLCSDPRSFDEEDATLGVTEEVADGEDPFVEADGKTPLGRSSQVQPRDGVLTTTSPEAGAGAVRVRRTASAYMFFCKDHHSEVQAQMPGLSVRDIARELGRRWAALAPSEKAPYEARSMADRVRFQNEKAVFGYSVASRRTARSFGGSKLGAATTSASTKTPTKPLSAFALFSNDVRHSIRQQHPLLDMRGIAIQISRRWALLSDPERAYYHERERADLHRYDQALSLYKRAVRARVNMLDVSDAAVNGERSSISPLAANSASATPADDASTDEDHAAGYSTASASSLRSRSMARAGGVYPLAVHERGPLPFATGATHSDAAASAAAAMSFLASGVPQAMPRPSPLSIPEQPSPYYSAPPLMTPHTTAVPASRAAPAAFAPAGYAAMSMSPAAAAAAAAQAYYATQAQVFQSLAAAAAAAAARATVPGYLPVPPMSMSMPMSMPMMMTGFLPHQHQHQHQVQQVPLVFSTNGGAPVSRMWPAVQPTSSAPMVMSSSTHDPMHMLLRQAQLQMRHRGMDDAVAHPLVESNGSLMERRFFALAAPANQPNGAVTSAANRNSHDAGQQAVVLAASSSGESRGQTVSTHADMHRSSRPADACSDGADSIASCGAASASTDATSTAGTGAVATAETATSRPPSSTSYTPASAFLSGRTPALPSVAK